jgi:TetR/AcrR family transcriptional regulator, transcriptional repressor for nem operon
MARPRGFDEQEVLEAASATFWLKGYEATSTRDLVKSTGLTQPSLYNAFGDKRALFRTALDRYVELSIAARIRRCRKLEPRDAIGAFFDDILTRSLNDRSRKGCLLVNSALEVAPHDAEFQQIIASVIRRIERFFLECLESGQAQGTITRSRSAQELSHHLVGVLMGVRVLARVKAERKLLEGVVRPALGILDCVDDVK